ncbi:MAG: sigma-54 dependent transcriptional regulator [Planctomycetota bacterium]|nr:sigma-54 dependent transcriptional regulator [Planctomycetota bacterium]
MSANLLLVEDDPLIRRALSQRMRKAGYRLREVGDVKAAAEALRNEDFDAVLVDFRLPDGTGFEVMQAVEERQQGTPCLMLTAHGSVEHAVEAMSRGAFTYLRKPVDADELDVQLAKALETAKLRQENQRLRRLRAPTQGAAAFLGVSAAAEQVRATIRQVAASPARSILLQGESGTGKGLVARAIHEASDRADRAFVPITCSAVPDNLLESELFGHEPGAFTDARKRKMGLLEAADGGTLFLDEIGDMPAGLQAKLLGVLEERRFRRVGGLKEIEVDVRVVSATHRNLEAMVKEGQFRADLLYRLRVIPIHIPPLRERPDDIPILAQHFVSELAAGWGRPTMGITEDAKTALQARAWPGNVRELRNALERAVILATGGEVDAKAVGAEEPGSEGQSLVLPAQGLNVETVMDDLVRTALDRSSGNQSAAARLLGMSRDQVRYRMQKMGLLRRNGAEVSEVR